MQELDLDEEGLGGGGGGPLSPEDAEFDSYIGALEDVLMGEGFTELQMSFCEKYCGQCMHAC
jgi:hypothetical protein